MYETHVRASRDLRNHYAELSGLVKEHNQVVITNNGRGESVLINIEDYANYEKYLHEKYVIEKLIEAEKSADNPNTQWVSHEEVWARLERKYDL